MLLNTLYTLNPTNIGACPDTPAVFALRHVASRKIMFSSASRLRRRLHWWHSRLSSAEHTGHIPIAMRQLLTQVGYDPSQWAFILWEYPDSVKPIGHDASHMDYVKRAHERQPLLLLNTYRVRPPAAPLYDPEGRNFKGVAPRSWLKDRLGYSKCYMPERLPANGWKPSPQQLVALPDRNLWFADYLYRCMVATTAQGARPTGVYNSTPTAIAELFKVWQHHHRGDPAIDRCKPPEDLEQALYNVPLPASALRPGDRAGMSLGERYTSATSEEGSGTINPPAPDLTPEDRLQDTTAVEPMGVTIDAGDESDEGSDYLKGLGI